MYSYESHFEIQGLNYAEMVQVVGLVNAEIILYALLYGIGEANLYHIII